MTTVSPINNTTTANLNAVKIKINDPRTIIPEEMKGKINDGMYNAVDIEVNRPATVVKSPYIYPKAEGIVTYDKLALPKSNVPAPNITTVEAEKKTSFKAAPTVEIVSPKEIKPEIDLSKVLDNLNNNNFDIQALEMEEITRTATENPKKAISYITSDVFDSLIGIAKKDITGLEVPSEKQIDIRKKIIINKIIEEQTLATNPEIKKENIELPYHITDEDIKLATTLTSLEQAERNKEYALYTIASLTKVYTNEVQNLTGTVVPMTDLPGISAIVDSLRYSANASIKIAAIDALRYIARPEYQEELISLFTLAEKDNNQFVAQNASIALENLNK